MRKILKNLELEILSVSPSDSTTTSSFSFQRHIIVHNQSPKMKRLFHNTLHSEIKTSTETVAMTTKAVTTRASTMQNNYIFAERSTQSRHQRRIPAKNLSPAFPLSSLSSSSSTRKSSPQTLLLFLIFLLLLSISSAFNVETSFPVIHQGVGVDQNSFFGFSISQFKSQGENYILVGAPRHHHHSAPSPFSSSSSSSFSSSSSSSSSPPSTPSTGRGALFRCRANPFTDSFGAQQLCQDLKIDEDVSDRVTQSQEVRM